MMRSLVSPQGITMPLWASKLSRATARATTARILDGLLYSNTDGDASTAIGKWALYLNTTGTYNTATGIDNMVNNTTGSLNTPEPALKHATTLSWCS
jgi:hypothetical protein